MKAIYLKSLKLLVITGFTLSFLLTLSIVPFSQTRSFQKSSKSTGSSSFKSFSYSNEYNLTSYIHCQEESRQSEEESNRDFLHFLSFTVPFSNSLLHYFNSRNFTYNLHSYFISQLYNIPPPF